MNRNFLAVGLAALVGAAIFAGALMYLTGNKSGAAARSEANLVQFYSPTIGNPAAKVHIVEFLDPACETCASFYPQVKQILAANPDKIRLTIRHVPFHKNSDYVIRILDAARKQGKYWQTLETLLANQPSWVQAHVVQPEAALQAVAGLGLNQEQLKTDMEAPEIAQRIEQELKDAKALKVTQTPEYFVNGRPLPTFGMDQLQKLIQEELKAAYP